MIALFGKAFRLLRLPERRPPSEPLFSSLRLAEEPELDLKTALSRWLGLIESGRLLPHAPWQDPLGRLTAPLQFWGQVLLAQALPAPSPSQTLSLSEALLLDALPRILKTGLSVDHAVFNRGLHQSSPHPALVRSCGYMSSSQRPLLHLAIGHDAGPGLSIAFVRGLLDAGADPNGLDAFGTPALALCPLNRSRPRAIALWELLVERGARPDHPMSMGSPAMGGLAQNVAANLLSGLPNPAVADLARLYHAHPGLLEELDARALQRALAASIPAAPRAPKASL